MSKFTECEMAFSKIVMPIDGRHIGPAWYFEQGWNAKTELHQTMKDVVTAAMMFDDGGDYGILTSACARLRGLKK